jgi:hypothetical protein
MAIDRGSFSAHQPGAEICPGASDFSLRQGGSGSVWWVNSMWL